jgi:hypothetical protein
MKSRIVTLSLTALALLLGQPAFAHQNTAMADAAETMLCVDVVAAANVQPAAPGMSAEDKAVLQARIKQESREALKQATTPAMLQKQSRQAVVGNGKLLQASL